MLYVGGIYTGSVFKDKEPPSWWDLNKEWMIPLIIIVAVLLALVALYWYTKIKENHKVPRTVTFYGYGIKTYRYGSYLFPDIPKKEGFVFMGWYKDTSFVERWKSTDRVKRDITLYPKWVKEG